MQRNLIAKASVLVAVSRGRVWEALTNPLAIKQYMFGARVDTDWQEGSPIFWRGEWQGKPYEDKGEILKVIPRKALQYSHYSPLSGLTDIAENYHVVTIELHNEGNQTRVDLAQDNNATEEERIHSEKNWEAMLGALKKYAEN